MMDRTEIRQFFLSQESKKLWQTIKQELPQLHFDGDIDDSLLEARIDNLENFISDCNTLLSKYGFSELDIKDLYAYLPSERFKFFLQTIIS